MRLTRQKKRGILKSVITVAFFVILFCLLSLVVPFNESVESIMANARAAIADMAERIGGSAEAIAESGAEETGKESIKGESAKEGNLPDEALAGDGREEGTASKLDGDEGFLTGGIPSETSGFNGFVEQERFTAPEEATEPEEQEELEDPEELWRKTFSPVPASPPVHISYFDDALFIGDSRVVGLMLYSDLTEATFYAEKGVNISTLLTNKLVMQTGGVKIPIPEALMTDTFGKIYIKMGLNELGWKNLETFAEAYGQVIDRIRELQPEAVFYVQSIIPVSRKKSMEDKIFNNERISLINELIKKMTWEKGVYYLDVYSSMTDLEGFLPEDAGSDGIHMNKKYCKIWLEYLLRHTVRDHGDL